MHGPNPIPGRHRISFQLVTHPTSSASILNWANQVKSLVKHFDKTKTISIALLSTCPLLHLPAHGQDAKFVPNYDEASVPAYELPDPLEGVEKASDWESKRAELYALMATQMFGTMPPPEAAKLRVVSTSQDKSILDGKGILRQLRLEIADQSVDLVLFLPHSATEKPAPIFLGYNFGGNHTVFDDDSIVLPRSWMRKTPDHKAHEEDRGSAAKRWAIEEIVDANFGLATLYYGDIDPDFDDGFKNGVHSELGVPSASEAASIGTWAWALSRVVDALETVDGVDTKRIAVMGHSRLGKTSLWAGASDKRFALVISNNSGCGGAALSRRRVGETVWKINDSFPHWFCGNFKQYGRNEDAMPFDSHTLLALIAPRPVYVASANDDRWADPKGEFLSCVHADPVYKLLGTSGLPSTEFPSLNKPLHGTIGYHIRQGKHDVTNFDWQQYIQFATKHLLE